MKCKYNISIKIRGSCSWEDWFLSVEDKKKRNVYHVESFLYLNDFLVAKEKIPINFSELMWDVKISNVEGKFDEICFLIPEMNLVKKSKLVNSTLIRIGDTLNFSYKIKME